ncbi:MAG TPA: hypothetical protein VNX68_05120 [Nitrosopumilaceae archaeon]|jgi:hypothetical protein|nr:hypothetical protein [Nitrosopumilaceae archaeon]
MEKEIKISFSIKELEEYAREVKRLCMDNMSNHIQTIECRDSEKFIHISDINHNIMSAKLPDHTKHLTPAV